MNAVGITSCCALQSSSQRKTHTQKDLITMSIKTIEVPTLEYLQLKGPWRGNMFTKVDEEGVHIKIEVDCGCDITPRSMYGFDDNGRYVESIKESVELVRDTLGKDTALIIHLKLRKAEAPLYPVVAPVQKRYDKERDMSWLEFPEGFRDKFESQYDIEVDRAIDSCSRVPKIDGVIYRPVNE